MFCSAIDSILSTANICFNLAALQILESMGLNDPKLFKSNTAYANDCISNIFENLGDK